MRFYRNGNYTVCIKDDGTKIRRTDDDDFIPAFAENVDVKITSSCCVGCSFCYENCTKDGRHGHLFAYPFINSLHPYTEMALNGNDMNHPDLERFLMFLHDRHIFANITVHQLQFMNNYDKIAEYASQGFIHGIGISYSHHNDDFIQKVQLLPNAVIHTINGVLTYQDIQDLKGNNLKILILGYKDMGRGHFFLDGHRGIVKELQDMLRDTLPTMLKENWFRLVSFDNLAIEQLGVRNLLTEEEWQEFYMGDDGRYTFYIDMVDGTFARNSISRERYEIGNKTIDEMFNLIRKENEKAS